MISIEGYSTLAVFYRAAQRSIYLRLGPALALVEANRERGSQEFHRSNVAVAAKFLVHDLFSASSRKPGEKRKLSILRADGSLAALDLDLLKPSESVGARDTAFASARREFLGEHRYMESIFGLRSLRSEYWHEAFLSTNAFLAEERRLVPAVRDVTRYIPFIDWQTAAISTTELGIFVRSMDLIYEAQSALASIGVEMGSRAFQRGATFTVGSPENIYRMMHPFNGCTVVAPADWADELFVDLLPREVTRTPHRSEKDPKYMIVDLYRENPFLTKEEFREQLYPEMPRRQFNKHWQYAADIEPNIQKPGRRRSKS